MAKTRRHNRRKPRRGRFAALYKMLSVVLILAAVVVGSVVFFRVNNIQIEGNSRYSDQEIIDISGVVGGDNLFALNRGKIVRELLGRLPYIESVTVGQKLPDTLVITVGEGQGVATLLSGGSHWVLGADGKILEQSDQANPQLISITGLTPIAPAVGTYLAAGEGQSARVTNLKNLLKALRENHLLEKTAAIDLTDGTVIRFTYNGDLLWVELTPTLDFQYWMRRFAEAVDNPAVVVGQSYTVKITDGEKIRFIPR